MTRWPQQIAKPLHRPGWVYEEKYDGRAAGVPGVLKHDLRRSAVRRMVNGGDLKPSVQMVNIPGTDD